MITENLLRSAVKSELDKNQLQLLIDNSEGLVHIDDLRTDQSQKEQIRGRYALGIGTHNYESAVLGYDLTHWANIPLLMEDNVVKDRVAQGESRIEIFMDDIISPDRIPVVFFVPNQVFSHPNAGVTKREINWCLNHPERLGATKFVFGLYDDEA